MSRESRNIRHHGFDHEFDTWRYVEDCGCELCVAWELETTGLDHPTIDDVEEWWQENDVIHALVYHGGK